MASGRGSGDQDGPDGRASLSERLLPQVEHVQPALLTVMAVLLLLRLASISDYVSSTSLAVIREVGVVNAILGLSVPLAPLGLFVFGLAVVLLLQATPTVGRGLRLAVCGTIVVLLLLIVPAPYGPLGPGLLLAYWLLFLVCLLAPELRGRPRGAQSFVVLSVLLAVLTTPFDRTMWLPAERITVLEGAEGGSQVENAYVGYALSQTDDELTMLMEAPRGVVRLRDDDVRSRYVCQLEPGEQRLPLLLAVVSEARRETELRVLRRTRVSDVEAACFGTRSRRP